MHKKHIGHTLPAHEVAAELGTKLSAGLSDDEARERLSLHGPNELMVAMRVSALRLFFDQFKNTLLIILLIATAVSAVLGHTIEAVAIGVIIVFAVILGFVQEFRAEKAIEALRKMAAPLALVLRSGVEREMPARELVPGDVILISTGDRIPADARLIESINLKIEEAALTGESVAVEKKSEFVAPEGAALGDRRNMVFAGTSAVYGRGRALVVATAMHTEFGRIAGMLQQVEKVETPLEKSLDRVGTTLTRGAFVLVLGIVLLGVFRGQPLLELVIFGVALAVAVVPEALPAVVTISLAIGVQRMARRHALVRHMPAAETLGSTTIICSDKTGTLTKDEMTVRKILVDGDLVLDVTGSGYDPSGEFLSDAKPYAVTDSLRLLLQAAALNSDASLAKDGAWELKGDPTEGALVVAAQKAGLRKEMLDEQYRRVAEIPFSSETKRMTTLHETPAGRIAYGKGAPEVILGACTGYEAGGKALVLTEEMRRQILAAAESFARDALRVIAVAYGQSEDITAAQKNMIFLGLFGMIDPPRPEAKASIERCQRAGLKLMMITGDHPITAEAIARELGLLEPGGGRIATGADISGMSDSELRVNIEKIQVCARVSPEHKLRIVEALQHGGHVVAMTGDGVNDAPALKKADIGIAMGITGTDVSKEAAVMTLTDDNFASIVAAIEEGRIIFGNIKKYLMYLLSSNIGEIGLMAAAAVLGLPLPLTAVQLLYVNLATDGLPALALAVDPPEADLMQRPPRRRGEGIFTRKVVTLMVAGGVWSALVNLGLFARTRSTTMVFVSLVLIEFFKSYNFRSDRVSVFHRPFANKWLNRAILWELGLLLLVIYHPFLQRPFQTAALTLTDWALAAAVAATVIPVLEIVKWILRRVKE